MQFNYSLVRDRRFALSPTVKGKSNLTEIGISSTSGERSRYKNNVKKMHFLSFSLESFTLLFPLYKPVISQNFYVGVKV